MYKHEKRFGFSAKAFESSFNKSKLRINENIKGKGHERFKVYRLQILE
jgi:hypothetical protein